MSSFIIISACYIGQWTELIFRGSLSDLRIVLAVYANLIMA